MTPEKDHQLMPTQMNQMLELSHKDFKAAFKMLQLLINSLETTEKIENLGKEIEIMKKELNGHYEI